MLVGWTLPPAPDLLACCIWGRGVFLSAGALFHAFIISIFHLPLAAARLSPNQEDRPRPARRGFSARELLFLTI